MRQTIRHQAGKARLDQPPSRGEISIALRQFPDTMEMIRQQYPGRRFKGKAHTCFLDCGPQRQAASVLTENRPPAIRYDSEKIRAAGDAHSAVFGHTGEYRRWGSWFKRNRGCDGYASSRVGALHPPLSEQNDVASGMCVSTKRWVQSTHPTVAAAYRIQQQERRLSLM